MRALARAATEDSGWAMTCGSRWQSRVMRPTSMPMMTWLELSTSCLAHMPAARMACVLSSFIMWSI